MAIDPAVKRTIKKIKTIRDRIDEARMESARTVKVKDSFEYDIILKALELLRQTISVGNREADDV